MSITVWSRCVCGLLIVLTWQIADWETFVKTHTRGKNGGPVVLLAKLTHWKAFSISSSEKAPRCAVNYNTWYFGIRMLLVANSVVCHRMYCLFDHRANSNTTQHKGYCFEKFHQSFEVPILSLIDHAPENIDLWNTPLKLPLNIPSFPRFYRLECLWIMCYLWYLYNPCYCLILFTLCACISWFQSDLKKSLSKYGTK